MNGPVLTAIVAIAAVAGLAIAARRLRNAVERAAPPYEGPPPEPDRIWLTGGSAIVTWCGDVYEVSQRVLPRGLVERGSGAISNREFAALSPYLGESDTDDGRLAPGTLTAAKLVRSSRPGHMPWRIDALDAEGGYRLYGFESERDARAVLALFHRRVIDPQASGRDSEIEAGRHSFEGELEPDEPEGEPGAIEPR